MAVPSAQQTSNQQFVHSNIAEVDFDTFEFSQMEPTLMAARGLPSPEHNIRISWDPREYDAVGPATWTHPPELWGKPYNPALFRPGEGSAWGPKLDLLATTEPKPAKRHRPRPGILGKEVRLLYNAMSFKTWQDERGFDTLITVSAWYLGITNDAEFSSAMSDMNKAARAWLANGIDKRRYRRARGCRPTAGTKHLYIYTLERSYSHGLHVHELCVVPPPLQVAFREFLTSWWENRACMAIPKNAVHVRYAHSASPHRQYIRQHYWFRYIIKTMHPELSVVERDGSLRPLRDVLRPWRRGETPDVLPIACPQLYGIAREIDQGEQRRRGFVSKFDLRQFDKLYDGSEVTEAQMRWLPLDQEIPFRRP